MTLVPLGRTPTLVVHTESDWHIGSGTGVAGDLNAVVRRDADGLPYLPGTTLTGVLRDACRVVASALDDGDVDGPWQRWQVAIFGMTPDNPAPRRTRRLAPALVGFGAARFRPGLRARLRAPGLATAATARRPGVAIEEESGRAADETLRVIEVARGGVDLVADVTVEPLPDEESARAATALLVLGTAWCRQIGGGRRRGLGQVTIELDGRDATEWAAWLAESGWTPPEPPTPAGDPGPTAGSDRVGDTAWHAIDLRFTTVGPVRVPRQVTGNLVRGFDHLPGSLLLPWLSQRWGPSVVRAAIWEQSLVARNALPDVAGVRGIPAPLSMYRSRDGDERDLFLDEPRPASRQVRGRYTDGVGRGGEVRLQPAELSTVSHNAVNPETQRPDSESGIYELEVIPPGTSLRAQVLVRAALVDDLIAAHGERPWLALAGSARFGARRRGEYGAVDVEVLGCAPVAHEPPPGETFRLWLVSDLLVRGPGLRYTADPRDVAAAMSRELGVAVELVSATARTRRRDSWHAGWQLPRESLVGLTAGSVLELRFADGPPAADRWSALLAGIGDRIAEGYGEVLADASLLAEPTLRLADPGTPAERERPDVPELHPADEAALAVISAAVTAERVRFAVADTRNTAEYQSLRHDLDKLSRSQRGTWRAQATTAAVAGSLNGILAYIRRSRLGDNPRRAGQRTAATLLECLVGGPQVDSLRSWWHVLAEVGVEVRTERDRAVALATLVSDVVDELRREETPA